MKSGLIAGSLAAVVAALVSLPLRSPSDAFLNSATVVMGVVLVGLAAGLAWDLLGGTRRGPLYYAVALGAGLLAVAVLAMLAETQVDRVLSFSVPLAAIAFLVGGALVPALARSPVPAPRWSAPGAVVIALGVGVSLAGMGDGETGELSLPPRAETSAPTAASSPPDPGPPASPTAEPAAEEEPPASPTAEPAVEEEPPASPTAEPAVEEEPPAPEFAYVVGDGSKATFTVREELAGVPLPFDAVIRTETLAGGVNLDGRPSVIEIDLHSLSSDQTFRDRYIRNTMFPRSPVATFTVAGLDAVPDGLFEGDTVTAQVDGSLNIRGVDVPLTFEVEARKDGDVLLILGRTVFTWDQLKIARPSSRNVVSLDDEVRVEVLLQAAPSPAAGV